LLIFPYFWHLRGAVHDFCACEECHGMVTHSI
jgi:hypothetical protein